MENNNDSLKIYLFDRVMPIAYVEIVLGLIMVIAPTAIMFINKKVFMVERGLTDPGIAMLIVAIVLFWVGVLVIAAGSYKKGVCEHGFLAERDGHVYAFSLNAQRIKDGNIIPIGKISKIINGINAMGNRAYYTKKLDELKNSPELYEEVNKILDDSYSFLYFFRDINSNKFTSVERKSFKKEYKRLCELAIKQSTV